MTPHEDANVIPFKRASDQPALAPHQLRVVEEKANLDSARERLEAFLRSGRTKRVDAAELDRMREQQAVMDLYSSILGRRINAWPRIVAEPMEPQRGEMGEWEHPALPWDTIPEDTVCTPYVDAWGYESSFSTMEDEDNSEELFARYEREGSFLGWTPDPPAGEGWFLGAMYDTESGPAVLWLRPKAAAPEPAESTVPQDVDAAGQINADGTADGMAFYLRLRDLVAEAGAVKTPIGRPEVLERRLMLLRTEIGRVTASTLRFSANTLPVTAGAKLEQAARHIAAQAGADADEFVAWLLGGGFVEMVLEHHKAGRTDSTPAPWPLSAAARDVLAERRRQVEVEGWTPEHDDRHRAGTLATAAACYALSSHGFTPRGEPPAIWPWATDWWKPKRDRRDLVKAGALILAEIERLDRASAAPKEGGAA